MKTLLALMLLAAPAFADDCCCKKQEKPKVVKFQHHSDSLCYTFLLGGTEVGLGGCPNKYVFTKEQLERLIRNAQVRKLFNNCITNEFAVCAEQFITDYLKTTEE